MRRGIVIAALLALTACGTTVNLARQSQGGAASGAAASGDGGENGLALAPNSTGAPPSATSPSGTPLPSTSAASGGAPDLGGTPDLGSVPPSTPATVGAAPSTTASADTAPIELGFLDTETSNASSFGANTGSTFSSANAAQALVDAFNAHGGIDGRKITAVIARTDTGTATWDTDFAAACAKFTQDNHVTAVLGYTFAFLDSFENCLTKAGVVHLDDGYNTGDAYAQRQYPYHFSLANPTFDRHYLEQLSAPTSGGYITKSSKLGLILGACPYDERAWNAQGAPFIKAHGLNVAAEDTLGCVGGANDDAAAVAEITGAVLKFRSARVDRIVGEGVPIALFAVAAEAQGWYPGYVVTSWSGGNVIAGTGLVPADQEANIHGYGWLPSADVDPSHAPPPNAAQLRCLALYKSKGLVPRQYSDFITAYEFCDAMFMYEAALKATNGHSDAVTIQHAIEQMGTSYLSPTTLDGATRFSPTQHDGPTLAAPWGWTTSCKCFTYQGPAQPLP